MTAATTNKTGDSDLSAQPGAIDWSVLDSLKMLQRPGKPDLLKRLMTLYLGSSPGLMRDITNAVEARDGQALMNAAHALKSSSMSLGAKEFATTCATLEQLGRTNTLDEAQALQRQAETEFAAVCSAFQGALDENA